MQKTGNEVNNLHLKPNKDKNECTRNKLNWMWVDLLLTILTLKIILVLAGVCLATNQMKPSLNPGDNPQQLVMLGLQKKQD